MNETYRSLQKAVGGNDGREAVKKLALLLAEISVSQSSTDFETEKAEVAIVETWSKEVERRLNHVYSLNLPTPVTQVHNINGIPIINVAITPSPLKDDQTRYLLIEPVSEEAVGRKMHELKIPARWQAVVSPLPARRIPSNIEARINSYTYHNMRDRVPLRESSLRRFRILNTDATIILGVTQVNANQYQSEYETEPPFHGEYIEIRAGTAPYHSPIETAEVSSAEMDRIFEEVGVYSQGLVDKAMGYITSTAGYNNVGGITYRYLVPLEASGKTERFS